MYVQDLFGKKTMYTKIRNDFQKIMNSKGKKYFL